MKPANNTQSFINAPLGPSVHEDTFTRDNLPAIPTWPEIDYSDYDYPEYINIGEELTNKMVEKGFGEATALIGQGRRRSYAELDAWSNQIAHTLVNDYGIVPGNRILIRGGNTPAFVACWVATCKVGAVAVNTMPMLRSAELTQVVDIAEASLALCDNRLLDELQHCASNSQYLKKVVGFDGEPGHDSELDKRALSKPKTYDCIRTGRDDVALLGFTSGTTGKPKATMHFHRDLLIIADGYAKEVLNVQANDVFIGSPPLAFTFGLGGLVIFPLRFGATAVLLENASPANMLENIEKYRGTVCFTAPTAYRMILKMMEDTNADISSLRLAVSAGEALPKEVFQEWTQRTNLPILDGIGATEMLHIFISNSLDDYAAERTGKVVKGYQATILDENGQQLPPDSVGRLAIKGPTGCRYLNDERQANYVFNGWNITGDSFRQDEQGVFYFIARTDDMIISSGYNISAPEVENALLSHPAVLECAVVGCADAERGSIVQAHVVLEATYTESEEITKALQDHVKNTIAPYKYPRSIVFCQKLPKTATGKIQRHLLKNKT